MTIVAGDILRTSVNFTLGDGSQFQNVYHHQRSGVDVHTDATHVAAIKTWAETMYADLVTICRSDIVEALSSVDLVEFVGAIWKVTKNIGTFTPTFTPTGSAGVLPNQIAPFLIMKTHRPKTVGRKFLFPSLESQQEAGIVDSAVLAALAAFGGHMMTYIALGGASDLILGVPRTGIDAWYGFYSVVFNDLLGTQRRRRPGYGA